MLKAITLHSRRVLCDLCYKDYTDREECGGFLFQSKAVCPECSTEFRKEVEHYGEEGFIRGACPEGKSFRDWVLGLR